MSTDMRPRWAKAVGKRLIGRTITAVHYLDDKETEAMGFHHSPVVLDLDDGNWIIPSCDEEGNDAGALFTSYKDLQTIPTI